MNSTPCCGWVQADFARFQTRNEQHEFDVVAIQVDRVVQDVALLLAMNPTCEQGERVGGGGGSMKRDEEKIGKDASVAAQQQQHTL
jgi:hypothetical protein